MNSQSEVDEVLGRLGSVEPAPGFEKRIKARLNITGPRRTGLRFPRGSGSVTATPTVAACALAASLALAAVGLHPALHHLSSHHAPAQGAKAVQPPPTLAAPAAGLGTASEIHVPAQPVPVPPTPLNQGRGRSRNGRATLPNQASSPLPRGVAPALPEVQSTAQPQ